MAGAPVAWTRPASSAPVPWTRLADELLTSGAPAPWTRPALMSSMTESDSCESLPCAATAPEGQPLPLGRCEALSAFGQWCTFSTPVVGYTFRLESALPLHRCWPMVYMCWIMVFSCRCFVMRSPGLRCPSTFRNSSSSRSLFSWSHSLPTLTCRNLPFPLRLTTPSAADESA